MGLDRIISSEMVILMMFSLKLLLIFTSTDLSENSKSNLNETQMICFEYLVYEVIEKIEPDAYIS